MAVLPSNVLPPLQTSVTTIYTGQKLLTLAWPASLTNAYLEVAANLSSGSWTPALLTPTQSGGLNAVTIPATGDQQFFRLRQ
jgi:hypothetical protein